LSLQEKNSARDFIPEMKDQDDLHRAKLKVMKENFEKMAKGKEESMGIRQVEVLTKSNDDRLQELTDMGATYQESLRIMVEEGR